MCYLVLDKNISKVQISSHNARYCLKLSLHFARCIHMIIMVALWNRADHYIFILWFLSSLFYLFFLA